ncbi:MAG: WYL domain-containing protein [Bacteroidaceae bacterium]|nr:WYL domain-containing protein [Bacteroidaceae bacterium]
MSIPLIICFLTTTKIQKNCLKSKEIHLKNKWISAVYFLLHASQEEVETCEEYSIFTLYLSPTWDFKQELLSRADQLEVLAPTSLREWMKEMMERFVCFIR